jgi:hypothetical protein
VDVLTGSVKFAGQMMEVGANVTKGSTTAKIGAVAFAVAHGAVFTAGYNSINSLSDIPKAAAQDAMATIERRRQPQVEQAPAESPTHEAASTKETESPTMSEQSITEDHIGSTEAAVGLQVPEPTTTIAPPPWQLERAPILGPNPYHFSMPGPPTTAMGQPITSQHQATPAVMAGVFAVLVVGAVVAESRGR